MPPSTSYAVLLALVLGVGQSVLAADKKPLIADPTVEKVLRKELKKPEGELTKADLAKVRRLALSTTRITDAGLKEVAKMKQLTKLHLSRTKITDAGLKEVAKLEQLKVLFLNDTQITDAGLKEMAKLQQLERLHLYRTKITDAGAAVLKKALPKCKIYSNPTN